MGREPHGWTISAKTGIENRPSHSRFYDAERRSHARRTEGRKLLHLWDHTGVFNRGGCMGRDVNQTVLSSNLSHTAQSTCTKMIDVGEGAFGQVQREDLYHS